MHILLRFTAHPIKLSASNWNRHRRFFWGVVSFECNARILFYDGVAIVWKVQKSAVGSRHRSFYSVPLNQVGYKNHNLNFSW